VVVGSGFLVPPPVEEFPILRFPAPPESFEHQVQVSQTVRSVVNLEVPLGVALNGDRSFIYSIPALDPYVYLRSPDQHTDQYTDQYIGVHQAPLPDNLHRREGAVWAYLADDYPQRDLVLKTLRPRSDFKPHHGGVTTTTTCLLAGIPQLLLPNYLEQWLLGFSVEGLGVGKMLTKPTWETLIATQAQVYALTEQAQQQAQRLAGWNRNFMPQIVDDCLARLQAKR
jgi:hypothetical protein